MFCYGKPQSGAVFAAVRGVVLPFERFENSFERVFGNAYAVVGNFETVGGELALRLLLLGYFNCYVAALGRVFDCVVRNVFENAA